MNEYHFRTVINKLLISIKFFILKNMEFFFLIIVIFKVIIVTYSLFLKNK